MDKKIRLSTDEALVKGIAMGNTIIIRQVYAKYFDSIAKYVLNNKGTIEDAKDLFQDALMVMYEKLQDSDFQLQYGLHTYLFAVCRNMWLKKLRKKSDKWVPLIEDLELINEDSFEEEILWREKERLYRQKFGLLDTACQKVLQLFFEGKSMEAIAQALGFGSPGYAKKRKYNCKKKLLELIKKDKLYQKLIES